MCTLVILSPRCDWPPGNTPPAWYIGTLSWRPVILGSVSPQDSDTSVCAACTYGLRFTSNRFQCPCTYQNQLPYEVHRLNRKSVGVRVRNVSENRSRSTGARPILPRSQVRRPAGYRFWYIFFHKTMIVILRCVQHAHTVSV